MNHGVYFNVAVPNFCPSCGNSFSFDNYVNRSDYLTQAAQSCLSCNTEFIHIEEDRNLSENIQTELDRYR